MLPKLGFMARTIRDCELLYSQSGTAVCKLGLACSEKYGDKESQLFIDAVAFGKTAEFINSVTRGQRVYVFGKIQTDQWTDNQGQKKSKISMVIDSFEYVEKRDNNSQQPHPTSSQHQQNAPSSYAQQNGQRQQPKVEVMQGGIPNIDVNDDEIPF